MLEIVSMFLSLSDSGPTSDTIVRLANIITGLTNDHLNNLTLNRAVFITFE